jgi:hypothetical protein
MQAPQQGNWCQPPSWEATSAPPPPPPPYPQQLGSIWPNAQHLGQPPFGAPTPSFLPCDGL